MTPKSRLLTFTSVITLIQFAVDLFAYMVYFSIYILFQNKFYEFPFDVSLVGDLASVFYLSLVIFTIRLTISLEFLSRVVMLYKMSVFARTPWQLVYIFISYLSVFIGAYLFWTLVGRGIGDPPFYVVGIVRFIDGFMLYLPIFISTILYVGVLGNVPYFNSLRDQLVADLEAQKNEAQ